MIDTVVLIAQPTNFRIFAGNKFTPPYDPRSTGRFLRHVQNPTKEDFLNGIYRPRLTLNRRPTASGFALTLKIECSLPKLLFGNNFDELMVQDLPLVIKTLGTRLREMGVWMTKEELLSCHVTAIHYSKNIVMTDGTTSSMLVNAIRKAQVPPKLELNEKEYRDSGYCIRWHANSYEVVFYDKKADLQKAKTTEKGRVEKDNLIQLSLFSDLKESVPFEVFRIEVRLTVSKMKRLAEELAISREYTLESLFNKEQKKKVLMHFWHLAESNILYIPGDADKIEPLIELTKLTFPKVRSGKVIEIAATALLLQQTSPQHCKHIVNALSSKRQWYRYKGYLSKLSKPLGNLALAIVKKQLTAFSPTNIKQYPQLDMYTKVNYS